MEGDIVLLLEEALALLRDLGESKEELFWKCLGAEALTKERNLEQIQVSCLSKELEKT